MDLSKLPKLSETPKPPAPDPNPQPEATRPDDRADIAHVDAGAGGMVWVSLILGALCMMLGRRFPSYLVAKLSGRDFHTQVNWIAGPNAGREVGYWELQGSTAWTEASIFLFGLALVLEALALWVITSKMGGKKIILTISLLIVIIATVFNIFTAVRVMGDGAVPLMSGLAAAFGGYMAMYQWKLLRVLSTGRAAPMT
jgi:hypothetical protein